MKSAFARILATLALTPLVCSVAQAAAPTFARYSTPAFASGLQESNLTAASAKADFDGQGMAVDPTNGDIYLVDADGADMILKITTAGVVSVFKTDAQLFAAIDAVNGTSNASGFNPRQLAFSADGDLIVVGFPTTNTTQDALLSITTAGVITVVYTATDANVGALDGTGALTVVGNTAYLSTDRSNGSLAQVYSVDTNAAGPTATVTTLVSEAQMDAFYDVAEPGHAFTGANFGINSLATDGVDLFATIGSLNGTNDVLKITTAGVISRLYSDTQLVAGLDALTVAAGDVTVVSCGGIAVDQNGSLWLANAFGTGTFDDTVFRITSAGIFEGIEEGNGTVAGTLSNMLGTTANSFSNDSLVAVRTGTLAGKVLFVENSESPAAGETIAITDYNSSVSEWSMY